MTLKLKHSREALEQVLSNVLELKSDSPIRDTLICNDFNSIKDLVNTVDTDIPNIWNRKSTKALEYLSIGHHNIIRIFIYYFQYQIHDNYPIGDDWVKINNDDFDELFIIGYNLFRIFYVAGVLNPRPNSITLSSNPYSPVDDFNIFIKCYPTFFSAFKYQSLWENFIINAISTDHT